MAHEAWGPSASLYLKPCKPSLQGNLCQICLIAITPSVCFSLKQRVHLCCSSLCSYKNHHLLIFTQISGLSIGIRANSLLDWFKITWKQTSKCEKSSLKNPLCSSSWKPIWVKNHFLQIFLFFKVFWVF